jgi:polar amino acid transport system substrate-binding protein
MKLKFRNIHTLLIIKTHVIIGLSLSLFIAAAYAGTQQEVEIVLRAEEYTPYKYFNRNTNEFQGIYVDIVREAGKNLGISVCFKEYPWKRCRHMMEQGKADGICGVFKTEDGIKFMVYADEPLAFEEIGVFFHHDRKIAFSGRLSDLFPYRVGITRGSSFGESWEQTKQKFNHLNENTKVEYLIKQLQNNRIDLITGNMLIIQSELVRLALSDQIQSSKYSIHYDAGYLAFSRAKRSGYENIAAAFAQEIKKLKNSGRYEEIIDLYTKQD